MSDVLSGVGAERAHGREGHPVFRRNQDSTADVELASMIGWFEQDQGSDSGQDLGDGVSQLVEEAKLQGV